MLEADRGYDLIGDVHGCADALQELLELMGYRCLAGVWRHPRRKAIFLGDLIDRGPKIRETLHLVHDMVVADQALCIMGNHEFNALGWYTPAPPGSSQQFVHEHTPRHERLLGETLRQLEGHAEDWKAFLAWFYRMPLLLEGGHFRVVHACWDHALIQPLLAQFADACVDEAFVQASVEQGSFADTVFNRLLRGTDLRLPHGMTLTGEDGITRKFFRAKFWEENPQTYGDIVFQPDALPEQVAQTPLSALQRAELFKYGADEPKLFVGHYWQRGIPEPIRPNLACLDYSAVVGGKLVAYRLDQEPVIEAARFVWVDANMPEEAR